MNGRYQINRREHTRTQGLGSVPYFYRDLNRPAGWINNRADHTDFTCKRFRSTFDIDAHGLPEFNLTDILLRNKDTGQQRVEIRCTKYRLVVGDQIADFDHTVCDDTGKRTADGRIFQLQFGRFVLCFGPFILETGLFKILTAEQFFFNEFL